MCGFKPGDEVMCVNAQALSPVWGPPPLIEGRVYVVESIHDGVCLVAGPYIGVYLVGAPKSATGNGWDSVRFRKVKRKSDSLSIEAFLTIKPGFEEPRRTNQPAKRKEQA